MNEFIIVDVIYMTGSNGGFENILNLACSYLCHHGFKIRYIQLVSSGIDWSADGVEFYCLDLPRDPFSFDEAKKRYARFLASGTSLPSLIMATGWPYINYVAKGATIEINQPIPVAAWLHNDLDYYAESGSGDISLLSYADIAFAINGKMENTILRSFPQKTVYRINNTVALPGEYYSTNRNTKKLAYVGRLSEEKAIAFLLYALNMAKSTWDLLIVGDGGEKKTLSLLAEKLRIKERVHFLGWKEQPWDSLSDCRALVLASPYEGGPLAAIEALACGMQVISTPVGFLPELIKDGYNGYLYPFGEPQALANILDNLSTKPYTPEQMQACRASIADFLPENTLFDFLCKVYASAKSVALPQKSGGNSGRFIRDHISVLVSTKNISLSDLQKMMNVLVHQTIEPSYMELVVAVSDTSESMKETVMVFEHTFPDMIIMVCLPEQTTSSEELEIAASHATGRFLFIPDNNLTYSSVEDWYLEQICKQEYYNGVI